MVDPLALNPFAALSMIAAPAVLTNASSVLAMSTSNRFLRATERMRTLHKELETLEQDHPRARLLVVQVPRLEQQAILLVRGLGAAYAGMGSFAAASLVSLIGAVCGAYPALLWWSHGAVLLALLAGLSGVVSLIRACHRLYQASRLAMRNIIEEAECIRQMRPCSTLSRPAQKQA